MQAGDTLQSIALQIWGDSNFWYLLADANGLDPSAQLDPGITLVVPNDIANNQNNTSTYRPYDPNAHIGDISPTHPPKPQQHHNCGVLGQILKAIVTVLTGDVFGQLFAMAVGIQKNFNWGELGMAAVSMLVPPGLQELGVFSELGIAGTTTFDVAAQAALSSVVSQGIDVAVGLQKSFNWTNVAAAAVSAGVMHEIGPMIGGIKLFNNNVANAALQRGLSSMAGVIVNASVRSLIGGTDFGDNIVSALPDVLAQTVGSALEQQIVDSQQGSVQSNNGPIGTVTVTPQVQMDDPPIPYTSQPIEVTSQIPSFNVTAQAGDSISTLLGTSDPQAIGAFMEANHLTSSTIYAGQTYIIPGSDGDANAGALGQSALNADNARIAAINAQYTAAIDGVLQKMNNFSASFSQQLIGAAPSNGNSINSSMQSNVVSSDQGGSGSSWITDAKNAVCSAVPDGVAVGGNTSWGGFTSGVFGVEAVLNFNSGQVSLFGYTGVEGGWNGGAQVQGYAAGVWGLKDDNSNNAGTFTTGSVGLNDDFGAFVSESGAPLNPIAIGPNPVTVVGVNASAQLADLPGVPVVQAGQVGYTQPLQVPADVSMNLLFGLPAPVQTGILAIMMTKAVCNAK
ncbi:MAG: LysM peptidoglycan-binding domain-containing protein [Alphaproteobacteria bacterium]|nr:LysM peptidoglycan-binding domain-containing protein [Alphaproteobacteria bacterium]